MEALNPTLSQDVYRTAATGASFPEAQNVELGRNAFLKLLVAQLEAQDPLRPQQDSEFVAQLATFSSLEQLVDLNQRVDSMVAGQSELALLQAQVLDNQAMDLIGRELLITTEGRLVLDGEQGAETLVYDLPESVSSARIDILSEDGQEVLASFDLGALAAGRHEFTWDGQSESGDALPPGDYGFRIETVDAQGQASSVAGFARVLAAGIHIGPDGLHLVAPGREIKASHIVEIGDNARG